MRICSAFLNLHVLWWFAACVLSNRWRCFLNLQELFLFACVFWSCSALSSLGHRICDENVMLLLYFLRCGRSNDGQNTDLGHWLVKNLISSIWVWFSEIKCKCLIIYKAKIPTLMTQCLIIGGKKSFLWCAVGFFTYQNCTVAEKKVGKHWASLL